jgi:hypothetical protein
LEKAGALILKQIHGLDTPGFLIGTPHIGKKFHTGNNPFSQGGSVMDYKYPFADADEKLKKAVWKKGAIISGSNPDVSRKDMCGDIIRYAEHGKTNLWGWEIDHIKPVILGGTDDLSNLQPLYWRNNRKKGDTYPWFCD